MIPMAPLHSPVCCHKFEVNMTLEFFDRNRLESKFPASSDFVAAATLSELMASILAIGFPSFCSILWLCCVTLSLSKNIRNFRWCSG